MVKFSEFIHLLTDEVCRADYLSLRTQKRYIEEMASHKAPVPGEGYLNFMAASEIGIQIHLKRQDINWFRRLLYKFFFKMNKQVYRVTGKLEADISINVVFKRPLSSSLSAGIEMNYESRHKGDILSKDWESQTYVIN